MKYIIESAKTVEQTGMDLESAVKKNGFGVLHIHDLQATLQGKGIPFQNGCKIYEVCNPQKANEVLSADMSFNMALPCRISVWEEDGKTRIGMLSPKVLLSLLSESVELKQVAEEVEETMKHIIEEAK